MSASLALLANAEFPIFVTEFGMIMFVERSKPQNAPSPILVKDSDIDSMSSFTPTISVLPSFDKSDPETDL